MSCDRGEVVELLEVEVETVENEEEGQGSVVISCSPALSGAQRRYLRSLAHHLKPVVLIGDKGIHEGVIKQIDQALLDHELIKVRARGADQEDRIEAARRLHGETGAQVAQITGRILVLYRAHPEAPQIVLPKARR